MGLKLAFVIDPLETLNVAMDTSLLMISEANRRGHQVSYCTLDDLVLVGSSAEARWTPLNYATEDPTVIPWSARGRGFYAPLSAFDVVVMRKDPPFDKTYLAATYILDYAGTVVVNSPRGLREANEKVFALRWPELMPRTFISRNAAEICKFIEESGGTWVIKPLDLCGGQNVFKLTPEDANLHHLINLVTVNSIEYAVVQSFIADVFSGDKRIFLVDGEPVGHMNRRPPDDDFRANIHLGATPESCTLSTRDFEIIDKLRPTLADLGLYHVCLDVIGGFLTEVNVTSPSGIPEINKVTGKSHECYLVDSLERASVRGRK